MSWCSLLSVYLSSQFVVVVPIVTITTIVNTVTTGTNQSAVNVTVNDEELDLSCTVESHPTAFIHWEENDVIVAGSSEVVELTVTANSSVRGAIITYTCVAENVVGGNSRSVSNNITVYVQGEMVMSITVYKATTHKFVIYTKKIKVAKLCKSVLPLKNQVEKRCEIKGGGQKMTVTVS